MKTTTPQHPHLRRTSVLSLYRPQTSESLKIRQSGLSWTLHVFFAAVVVVIYLKTR